MQHDINTLLDPLVNFGKVTVSTGYNLDTVIVLTSGYGTKLPNPLSDGPFNLVWYNASRYTDPSDDPNVEIVRCTARSGDILTVTRGQEGISVSSKNSSGDIYRMVLSVTKNTISDIQSDAQSKVNIHAALTSGVHGTGTDFLAKAIGSQYTAVNKAGDVINGELGFFKLVSDPTAIPNVAGIYAKDIGGTIELFAINSAGTIVQLTPAGILGISGLSEIVSIRNAADRGIQESINRQESVVITNI